MLKPWKPRGPNDRAPECVHLAVYATEADRDRVVMATLLTMPKLDYYERAATEYLNGLMAVKLPGGYGLVHTTPKVGGYVFRDSILKWSRDFHTEVGAPYAWRIWEKNTHYGDRIEAGRSPCNRGTNLRDVIRRTMPDFTDGRFREKGVTYG